MDNPFLFTKRPALKKRGLAFVYHITVSFRLLCITHRVHPTPGAHLHSVMVPIVEIQKIPDVNFGFI